MWRREREPDALARSQAAQAEAAGAKPSEPVDPSEVGRFTSGLPSARPTTEGERHAVDMARKADPSTPLRIVRRYGIHLTIGTLALVGGYLAAHRESEHAPKVGECAKHGADDKLIKVDCSDDAADFQVTSRVDDTDDGDTACATDPDATTYYAYSSGQAGVKFVLCLRPH